MRTFVLHPTTAAVLAGIETFLTTHDPTLLRRSLAFVHGVWIIAGAAPTDLEQRAIHDRLAALLPLIVQAIDTRTSYLTATAPVSIAVPTTDAGWGVG
jgi:hypothetical protein